MGDYPNSDEEFELMYQDELELLKEQENYEEPTPKSRKSLEFSANELINASGSTEETNQHVEEQVTHLNNSFETDFVPIQASQDEIRQSQVNNTSSNKRTIEELFGDIDDLLDEGYVGPVQKRTKTGKSDSDLALIEQILELRKLSKESNVAASTVTRDYTCKIDRDKYNISSRVPKFPFVVVTRHDGERIYIRCHSEEYEMEEVRKISAQSGFTGVMGESFKDIWKEANAQINKDLEKANEDVPHEEPEITPSQRSVDETKNLWVDLYKPKRYLELLSDESTNRLLLRWMKLWDRVVFNRRQKIKLAKVEEKSSRFKFKKQEALLKVDENGWPECKVALLCGPPGLGKTTLAHVVARHAGYNVIEINASDDRSLDKFKEALQNATSMRSVLDREGRPNCLIFDEIDGAPTSSIDFLVKFITGMKTNKLKNAKKQHVLKRPIICICNDIYVPSLRPLRQIALIVNFPPTLSIRLAERLNEIARYQRIKTDISALLAMAEKSHNDIRSCLSMLQFFKSQRKPRVSLSDVMKSSVGQKDMHEGLFSVWNRIFHIERVKQKVTSGDKDEDGGSNSVGVTSKTRMNKILHTVNSFGDYERLMQGVFENYPLMKSRDSSLVGVCEAIEWFCFSDILNKQIYSQQDYSLSTYLQYGFVVWHFTFASLSWQKLNYPSTGYEVRVKTTKQKALLTEMIRGMPPVIRIHTQPSTLKLYVLPYLIQIMVPSFRPVNLHLYTPEEKSQLNQVVSAMIDYSLTYLQERTTEGSFTFNLDPNVEELVLFPETKSKRSLSYSNRQIVAREIELEKMRRIEAHKNKDEGQGQKKETQPAQNLPNHLQQLRAKKVKPKETVTRKDFFGRVITTPLPGSSNSGPNFKYDIWYKFKEGYTNAVRRKIKVKDLM